MSIAQRVIDVAKTAQATTFSGGYAVVDGKNVQLPQGVCERENRNNAGRCTKAVYRYADNSVLTFTWSETHGPRFKAS